MIKHNLISIDLAKNVFQVCGMNRNGRKCLSQIGELILSPEWLILDASIWWVSPKGSSIKTASMGKS